ncbi:kinase-like domain-containing protein [Chytridium lagenaria]|nr:kinase-like domain-containing protein [Chytridium lagenaria]
MASFNIHPTDVTLIREIGRGGMGSVYEANLANHGPVAVKTLKHATMDRRLIIQEAETMSRLHHPSIVDFLGVVFDHPNFSFGIIIEYLPLGSLHDYYTHTPKLSVFDRLSLAADIARGMMYLHQFKVLHRDLKSLNVLVQRDGARKLRGKITDFGLAEKHSGTTSVAGTPAWMAPELQGDKKLLFATDVYSFGVVLTEIFSWKGPMPFNDEFKNLALDFSPKAHKLVGDCMDRNPGDRPDFEQIVKTLDALVADAAMHGGTRSTLASGYSGSDKSHPSSGYGAPTPSIRTDSHASKNNFASFNVNQSILPGSPVPSNFNSLGSTAFNSFAIHQTSLPMGNIANANNPPPRFQSNTSTQNYASFNGNSIAVPPTSALQPHSLHLKVTLLNRNNKPTLQNPEVLPQSHTPPLPSTIQTFIHPTQCFHYRQLQRTIQHPNAPSTLPQKSTPKTKWIVIAIIVVVITIAGAGISVFLALKKTDSSSTNTAGSTSSSAVTTGAVDTSVTTAAGAVESSPSSSTTVSASPSPSPVPLANFQLRSVANTKCLSANADNSVTLADCGDDVKHFVLITGSFGVNVRHVPTGFCLNRSSSKLIIAQCTIPIYYSKTLQNIYTTDSSGSPSSNSDCLDPALSFSKCNPTDNMLKIPVTDEFGEKHLHFLWS